MIGKLLGHKEQQEGGSSKTERMKLEIAPSDVLRGTMLYFDHASALRSQVPDQGVVFGAIEISDGVVKVVNCKQKEEIVKAEGAAGAVSRAYVEFFLSQNPNWPSR